MIFAATPSPVIAWDVILTVAVLLPMAVALISLLRSGKSQKREVTFGESFMTKEACGIEHRHSVDRITNCEHEIREIRKEVQVLVRTINETAADQSKETQQEISRFRVDVNESLRRVHARIDDIPNQVIVTLKNTGALD